MFHISSSRTVVVPWNLTNWPRSNIFYIPRCSGRSISKTATLFRPASYCLAPLTRSTHPFPIISLLLFLLIFLCAFPASRTNPFTSRRKFRLYTLPTASNFPIFILAPFQACEFSSLKRAVEPPKSAFLEHFYIPRCSDFPKLPENDTIFRPTSYGLAPPARSVYDISFPFPCCAFS